MQTRNFLFQNTEYIKSMINDVNPYASKIMKGVTDLGALFNKWMGKGKDEELTDDELKLIYEMEHYLDKMKHGGNLYDDVGDTVLFDKSGGSLSYEEYTKRNNEAKKQAKKRTKKEASQAKAVRIRDRKIKEDYEKTAEQDRQTIIDREKKEDKEILDKIDPENIDRSLVDRLHSSKIRSYLQHNHSLQDFKKFVDRLNKPRIDDTFYNVAGIVTDVAKEAIKSIPKIGDLAGDVLDEVGEVDNPNDKQREYYNNQLGDITNKIEEEYNRDFEGSGKSNFKIQSLSIDKNKYSKDEAMKLGIEILKTKKPIIRETKTQFRIRKLPKTQFEKRSFRTKKIKDGLSFIMGVHIKK